MGLREALDKVLARDDLTAAEAADALGEIVTGDVAPAMIAAFLVALRMKGESADEIAGFAETMRANAVAVRPKATGLVDTCGTGGDGSGTANISTAAAFVVAGSGIRVAKHGNRSMTSRCGSADVMEALQIDIQMPIDRLRRAIRDVGIGFLFAPRFHSSMKHVMQVRSQLRIRTVFNILGPLANPANARFQVVGVFSPAVMELMANALHGLGLDSAFVVHGADGVDEISISGVTEVVEMRRGQIRKFAIHPEEFGIPLAPAEAVRGGDPPANASIIAAVLCGEKGPRRNVVLLNAAAAILAGGGAATWKEAIRVAGHSIDSGAAARKLEELREFV